MKTVITILLVMIGYCLACVCLVLQEKLHWHDVAQTKKPNGRTDNEFSGRP